ncbi:hypothetical protein BVRB_021070, partial [Beta vulgaris subsp. vulgaris]
MMSYWISTAIECGFSYQWELRRMSDQIVSGLLQFSESICNRTLIECIRGVHRTWLDRARACLCARYLLMKDVNHIPDPCCFIKWANQPKPDRITVLSLAVLWVLIAKSTAAADRYRQFVLSQSGQLIVQIPGPGRDWFVHSIRDAILEVAQQCPKSQLDLFVTIVLRMTRSTSTTYRPDLIRALVHVDMSHISDNIADDIADLCIEMIADPESDPIMAIDILGNISLHHKSGIHLLLFCFILYLNVIGHQIRMDFSDLYFCLW